MRKNTVTLLTGAFIMVMLFTSPMPITAAEAGSNFANPDRYLLNDVFMYMEWDYNKTAVDALGEVGTISALVGFATETVEQNETIPASFIGAPGWAEEGNQADLNITSGSEFSSTITANIDSPTDDMDVLTQIGNGQKIAGTDEDGMNTFDNDDEMQFIVYESIDFAELEDDIANDVNRGWNDSHIDLKKTELVMEFNWDTMNLLIADIEAHERWTVAESMDTDDIRVILEDVLPAYTLGFHFGYANATTLAADTADLTAAEEVADTIQNKTDGNLLGYDRSAHMTNAVIGYLVENYARITAAFNMRQFGAVQGATGFGMIGGLELDTTENGTSIVRVSFFDAIIAMTETVGSSLSISQNMVVTFMESVPYLAWLAPIIAPIVSWLGIAILMLGILLLAVGIMTKWDWSFYFGKKKDSTWVRVSAGVRTVFLYGVGYLILLQLMTGYF